MDSTGLTTSLPGLRGMGLILNLRYPQPAANRTFARFCVTLCVTRCIKMGRFLMTSDDKASSASY
jgi:hypothetical protein